MTGCPALAAELVAARMSTSIVTPCGAGAHWLPSRRRRTIPIVITAIADMKFAFGLIDSLSRPGGNVTGLSFFNAELGRQAT